MKMTYRICPTCDTKNDILEKHCLHCGQKLIEEDEEEEVLEKKLEIPKDKIEEVLEKKLEIPKDKIILLDLNYTLISNSWKIKEDKYPYKILNRQYELELVEKIKDNYVILITATPYEKSFDSIKHIEENTDLKIEESYWNFNKSPPELKEYWLKKAVFPSHGEDPSKYLAIESNKDTRAMYAKYGIEARPKWDFIEKRI